MPEKCCKLEKKTPDMFSEKITKFWKCSSGQWSESQINDLDFANFNGFIRFIRYTPEANTNQRVKRPVLDLICTDPPSIFALKILSGMWKLTTFYLTKNDHWWVTFISLKTINIRTHPTPKVLGPDRQVLKLYTALRRKKILQWVPPWVPASWASSEVTTHR